MYFFPFHDSYAGTLEHWLKDNIARCKMELAKGIYATMNRVA